MQYLIIFRFVTPNEFVFPKHEQLESFVQQRGWDPVYREACIKAGVIQTADSEGQLRNFVDRRLASGETAEIVIAPEFESREALVRWAKALVNRGS